MKPFLRYTGLAALCAMLATLLGGCDFTRLAKDKPKPPNDNEILGGYYYIPDDSDK